MNRITNNKIFVLCYVFALNLLFLSLCLLLVEQKYDMPDTSTYPVYIAEGYYSFGFLNYFFCVICGALQSIIYPVNAYVVLQVVFSLLAFTMVSIIFLQKYSLRVATMAIVFLNAFYSAYQYSNISFTIYPGLLGIAGILCIIHFSRREKWLLGTIIGIILMILNTLFRFEVTESIIFVGVLFVIGLSLTEFFGLEKRERRIRDFFSILFERKRFFSFIIALLLCFSFHFASQAIINSTPNLKYYHEYTVARSAVWDYKVPSYDECAEQYDSIGINKNDLKMLKSGYMDDEGATTLDTLKAINKIKIEYDAKRKSFFAIVNSMISSVPGDIKGLSEQATGYISVGVVTLLLVVLMKKRRYFIPLFIFIAVFALEFYLWYIERTFYRTVHALWLSALIYLLYSFESKDLKNIYCNTYRSNRNRIAWALFIICIVFSFGCFHVLKKTYYTITTYSKTDSTPGLRRYIVDNKDDKFIFSREANLCSTKDNVHYIVKQEYDNTIYFNCTYYRYEGYDNEMKQFGSNNLYKSLLCGDAYFVDNNDAPNVDMMKQYLEKYYAKNVKIKYSAETTIDGFTIYKFQS